MRTKSFLTIIAIASILLNLQSCDKDPEITDYKIEFGALNIIENDTLSAMASNIIVTVNWAIETIENGEKNTISGTRKSNELPVRGGNEIEITFHPSCPEETQATFTMPDGTIYNVTTKEPSFKWKVPTNFTVGMTIKGESHFKKDQYKYNRSGIITLIKLGNDESK